MILTCARTAVAAARILESLDKDSDPCEDFYQFACGGWISQHPVPESQTSWDQFRVLQEKLLVQLRGVWPLQWNFDTLQMHDVVICASVYIYNSFGYSARISFPHTGFDILTVMMLRF